MGSIVTKSMEQSFRKNQELMTEMNKVALERQIQMQNQMRERAVAMQIAGARDFLHWFGSFYVIATIGIIAGFRRTRKPGILAPLVPLTFVTAYQTDMAYGNKIRRIRDEAESIMKNETDLLPLPCGLPTMVSLDQGRIQAQLQAQLQAEE